MIGARIAIKIGGPYMADSILLVVARSGQRSLELGMVGIECFTEVLRHRGAILLRYLRNLSQMG